MYPSCLFPSPGLSHPMEAATLTNRAGAGSISTVEVSTQHGSWEKSRATMSFVLRTGQEEGALRSPRPFPLKSHTHAEMLQREDPPLKTEAKSPFHTSLPPQ